jgi:superfamily II DNA/RNA helicase
LQTTTFAELGLSAKVQAAIEAAGYTNPTPIQQKAIPVAVSGRDILGIAQTGTGKTAGFVLPMLARLESGRARARMPRSLILAPTRELAAQVAQSFEKYGVNHKLSVALLIGGVSFEDQLRKLDRGVDVLIATPGRLLDHFGRGKILLTGVEILVIDEADRMLDMGFIPDIERICKLLPPARQTLFFSATMPPEIQRLVDTFLRDPARIEVARPATTANTITQLFRYCPSTEDWQKREMLRELIRAENVKNAIIFCNRKRDVAILLKSLQKHGFNAGALHGDMDQMSRMATLDAFREGRIQLLAASDVAARGLDIPDVSHIFNFDVPWQSDDYVHRIGRTGRAGKEGRSLTIVTPDDMRQLKDIEKMLGAAVTWIGDAPSAEDLASGGKRRRGRRQGKPQVPGAAARDNGHARGGRNGLHSPPRARHATRSDHEQSAQAGTKSQQRPAQRAQARRGEPVAPGKAPRGERLPQVKGERRSNGETPPSRQDSKVRQPWEPRPPRPQRYREDRTPSPVGLGDHVPAFLKRAPRSAPR